MPLVSIIMNCHNGSKYLNTAIESIYAQTYDQWEIVFWDNASTDESASIAKSFDRKLKYFRGSKKVSLGEARNLALARANGKYIAFLDCDDIYLPNKLERQVELIENSSYDLVYSSAIIIDENGKRIRSHVVKNKSGFIFPNLLFHYEINMQSVIFDKSILSGKELSFDVSLKYSPDYNLFMQISAKHLIGVIKEPLVQYRVLSKSLSSETIDLVAPEYKYTLDILSREFPYLATKFHTKFQSAYSKIKFYESVTFIRKSRFVDARLALKPIMFSRWEYFVLYFILFLPLPNSFFLRILKR